ncbi:MAG TPA: hypothetical protein VN372_11640 [Methanospirillum sp.]|nr:hypothetical protein [Methanospirillum sp.]
MESGVQRETADQYNGLAFQKRYRSGMSTEQNRMHQLYSHGLYYQWHPKRMDMAQNMDTQEKVVVIQVRQEVLVRDAAIRIRAKPLV